jgi:hypothetical protein
MKTTTKARKITSPIGIPPSWDSHVGPELITKKGLRKKWTGDFVGDSIKLNAIDQKAIPKPKTQTYVKPDTTVGQKNLIAQWAFPISRMEEFLDIFQKAVYNVIVDRLSYLKPIKSEDATVMAELEKHPKDARVMVSAILSASAAVHFGYRSTPDYSEVDYFFWITKGIVCFGCVLPGTELINGLTGGKYSGGIDIKTGKKKPDVVFGIKWIKPPHQMFFKDGQRISAHCPAGVIPSYVKMVSFYPGRMVGVGEVLNRMVKNPKERVWAINYAVRMRAEQVKEDRLKQVAIDQKRGQMETGGALMIAEERVRQINEEGYTADRDDSYVKGELARAAMAYAYPGLNSKSALSKLWPKNWDRMHFKPKDDAVENLVRAGALIAAEIDRVFRARMNYRPSLPKIIQDKIEKKSESV